ncbi:DsbA family protein [Liquorilactobacillus sucicola]|nr:DsbA family protein [Liquorilactobacillus sucicola]
MYLFINPIGSDCYHSEQNILRLVDQLDVEVRFSFIPFLNLQTVSSVMQTKNIPLNDLQARNQIFNNIYQASLDYKAASFQGKRCGRNYLLNLQEQIVDFGTEYNEEVAQKTAQASNLDCDMFNDDRHSSFTINSFKQDQQMAAEMNVHEHPTVVIYNLDGMDCGVSFTGCSSYKLLEQLCTGQLNEEIILKHKASSKKGPHTSLHIL